SSEVRLNSYINRGAVYIKQGRYQKAIEDYTKALVIDPHDALALANKGLALAKMGRYNDAIDDLSKALLLDPRNSKTLLIRGSAYFDKGSYRSAIKDYKSALTITPKLRQAKRGLRAATNHIRHKQQPCSCKRQRRLTSS